MTEQVLEIKYKCLHESCQIKGCREGVLTLEESTFDRLSALFEDKALFKSPRGMCRLGFPQTLKVINISKSGSAMVEREEGEGAEAVIGKKGEEKGVDPIEVLMEEHRVVLKRLELIEEQIRKRDIDGLWITTADVENDIILHSIEKEEGVLFPLLKASSPLIEGAISIMKEEHRELIALIDSIRSALKEGDIFDSVIYSAIANLRSHISKEDNEFFEMVDNYLDAEGKMQLLQGMAKADKSHIVVQAGNRLEESSSERDASSSEREKFNEALLAAKRSAKDEGCCH